MAKSTKSKKAGKSVQAMSAKANLSVGKSKPKDLSSAKVEVSQASAQKPIIVNQSKKVIVKSNPTTQTAKLVIVAQSKDRTAKSKFAAPISKPKKKTSPLIPRKEAETSHSVGKQTDKTVLLSATNVIPILTAVELEQLQLRQSISLLFMLNEIPQEALPNDIPTLPQQEDGQSVTRVLTLSQEKELTSIFAFLAGTSDAPRRIAAVCLEESLNHDSVSIKIAANHGDLLQTKEGFDRIARILKICQEDGTADIQRPLMETIVSIHQNRLLCRLRSRHAKLQSNYRKIKLTRPKILPALAQTLKQQIDGGSALNSLVSDINELTKYFTKLESLDSASAVSAPGLRLLMSILQTTHRLCHTSDFNALQLPEGWRLSLAKLSRYMSASIGLIRAARRHSFFADVSVEIVKFAPSRRVQFTPPPDFVESLIARLSLNTTPTQLLSRLGLHGGATEAHRRSRAARILCALIETDCAVHAEIQLLFYYEFHASQGLIPRVICSTKSACYLCNLFFSLHGRFYIPSTHGRIYEKWAFPERLRDLRDPRLDEVITNFNCAITDVIRQQVCIPRKRPQHPNESAYFFRSGVWSSLITISQRSLQLGQAAIRASRLRLTATDFTTRDATTHNPDPEDLDENEFLLHTISRSTSEVEKVEARSSHHSSAIETSTFVIPTLPPAPHQLQPETSLLLELGDPSAPVRIETAHIHIDLSRDLPISDVLTSNNKECKPTTERTWAAVDYLSSSEERLRISSSGIAGVDVAALAPGAHVTLDQHVADRGLCGFYVVCGAETLLMRCWNGTDPVSGGEVI